MTGGSHHPRTEHQSDAGNFPSKTGTHLHLGRVRKWRLIIFPKDKTRSTDAGNRTLDPQIQSPMLYRLSQQAPLHNSRSMEITLFETYKRNIETDKKRSLPYSTAPGIEGIEHRVYRDL